MSADNKELNEAASDKQHCVKPPFMSVPLIGHMCVACRGTTDADGLCWCAKHLTITYDSTTPPHAPDGL